VQVLASCGVRSRLDYDRKGLSSDVSGRLGMERVMAHELSDMG
jgi:hypothetical protein